MPAISAIDPFILGAFGGYILSMPVGPVNIIVLQKTIVSRALFAFLIGLGAALGDALYGGLAAFGIGVVQDFILRHDVWLRTLAGIVLGIMAWRIWHAHPHLERTKRDDGFLHQIFVAFFLTIANPGVFLAMLGYFTLVGVGGNLGDMGEWPRLVRLVFGVFAGAAGWWLTLTWLARKLRSRINDDWLVKVNRISALLVGLFAVAPPLSLLL